MLKTIGYVQPAIDFGDVAANFARVKNLLAGRRNIDLIVLPELAFTGYEFIDAKETARLAEPQTGSPTSEFLAHLSNEHNAVVIAGYPERAGNKIYNSAMIVSEGKVIGNYRKIHLFSRENDLFTPGDAPPAVFDTPAGRIGVMICFDWFFPEVARSLALGGAQVIAHPSNLVLPWCQRAMFARSVENHVYSITANRIGTETRAGRSLTFTGGSQVLGVDGTVLTSAPTHAESAEFVQVDITAADEKQLNPYNNLITSRRPELYTS